jgi:hypothetical protein
VPAKFERCVRKVKASARVRNPYAVCTAANAGGIKQYRRREARARRKA